MPRGGRGRVSHRAVRPGPGITDAQVVQDRPGHVGHDGVSGLEPHALLLEPLHDAPDGFEAERAPSGEHDAVHRGNQVVRIEEVQPVDAGRATADCDARHRGLVGKHDGDAREPDRIGDVPDADSGDHGPVFRDRRPAHVGELDAAERHLGADLEPAHGQRPDEGDVSGEAAVVRERGSDAGRQARRLLARGRPEDERHLREPPGPAASMLRRELLVDHRVHDRRLALGLDLIGDDEATLARLEQREGVLGDQSGIHEPSRELGQLEELGRPLDEGAIHLARSRVRACRRGRRLREEAPPPREFRRRQRADARVQRERLAHERAGAGRVGLDPRQLLMLAQQAQLGVEALPGDGAACRLEDADLVVEDERAELELAAEPAFEEDPDRAGSGAVDAGQPRSNGALRVAPDDWSARRRGR